MAKFYAQFVSELLAPITVSLVRVAPGLPTATESSASPPIHRREENLAALGVENLHLAGCLAGKDRAAGSLFLRLEQEKLQSGNPQRDRQVRDRLRDCLGRVRVGKRRLDPQRLRA